MSEELKERAIEAVRNVFDDTDVSPETTADHLKEIIEECNSGLQALREDGVEV